MVNGHAEQSVNGGSSRRRRTLLRGYFFQNLDARAVETPTSIRHLVFNIVALNVSTLKALQDGWHGSPQIINRCCDEYQGFLSPEEVELVDWLVESGGSRFEPRVSEYVNAMNSEQAMNYVMNLKTSEFYEQLIDLSLKKYRAAQAHAALASRASPDHMTIPEQFDYCSSYQVYVEHAAAAEQEMRNILRANLNRAKQLLYSIKVAVDDRKLDGESLATLKLKLLALQKYYPDAWAAVYGVSQDLFNPTDNHWWESTSPSFQGYQLPANEARAYGNSRSLLSTLSFFVPTICIVSCIPMGFAWIHSDRQSGTYDSNFYQLIAGSIIQLLDLGTLVYPMVFHARPARLPWLLTWALVAFGATCTISSIPLYLFFPTSWSMVIAFSGMIAQALILLQIVYLI